MGVLDEILANKRLEIEAARVRLRQADLEAACRALGPARELEPALRPAASGSVRLIAEVKKASPSRGTLQAVLDPAAQARAYAGGGASAVSVLTDEKYFRGTLEDLVAVRGAVELPLLRKEFILDEYQLWESRAAGADAVLLIVAALDRAALVRLLEETAAAGMDALVEVHTRAEAAAAAAGGAALVGVNARDLATLELDPGRFAAVREALPAGAVLVAESGIRTRADVLAAAAAGADAVLVGEHLVRATDPAAAVAELLAAPARTGGEHA